ncbi:MAG: hypothetical protein IJQ85_06965 [Selenomonadaceae bacterium]|nr:hypothetical protein [Selenomonadaceae bacterium]
MNCVKFLQRGLIAFLLTINFFTIAHAEIKTYEGVGEYFMTDEAVDFSKNQAELIAQRNLLEKICVYVKSQSAMIDNKIDNDEIITISAGIIRVIETKFSMINDKDGITVKSFVTAQVDTDELEKLLEQEIKNKI